MSARADHMKWAKQRAIAYVDQNDFTGALTSFISDLGKHPETARLMGFATVGGFPATRNAESMRRWIEGFAE